MSERDPIRVRWADSDSAEPMSRLMQKVDRPTLSPTQLGRVRSRLFQTLGTAPSQGPWTMGRMLALATVSAVVGVVLGLGAYHMLFRASSRRAQETPPVITLPRVPRVPRSEPVKSIPLPTPLPPPRQPASRPLAAKAVGESRIKEHPKAEPASNPIATIQKSPAEDSLIAESQLLNAAMQKWRRDNSPESALELLGAYQTQFPNGVLRPEAEFLRVNLLVVKDRLHEALALLDKQALSDDTPRAMELLILRAELRSRRSRCQEAIADFSQTLARVKGGLQERALYGRYRCYLERQDAQAARHDLADYLDRFPQGRFAAELRKTAPAATD